MDKVKNINLGWSAFILKKSHRLVIDNIDLLTMALRFRERNEPYFSNPNKTDVDLFESRAK